MVLGRIRSSGLAFLAILRSRSLSMSAVGTGNLISKFSGGRLRRFLQADYFRLARHSLITNSFDPQLIEVFLSTATTADHHQISDGEPRNRLSV
jgi:hypothetical protein